MVRPGYLSGIDLKLSKAANLAQRSAFYELAEDVDYTLPEGWWKQRRKWGEALPEAKAAAQKVVAKGKRQAKAKIKKPLPPAVEEVSQAAEQTLAKGAELAQLKKERVKKATEAEKAKAAGAKATAKLAEQEEKEMAKAERQVEKEFKAAQRDLEKKVEKGKREAEAKKKKEAAAKEKQVVKTETKKQLAADPMAKAELEQVEVAAVKEKQKIRAKRMKKDAAQAKKRASVQAQWVASPLITPREAEKRKRTIEKWKREDAKERIARTEEDAKLEKKHAQKIAGVARKHLYGRSSNPWLAMF